MTIMITTIIIIILLTLSGRLPGLWGVFLEFLGSFLAGVSERFVEFLGCLLAGVWVSWMLLGRNFSTRCRILIQA